MNIDELKRLLAALPQPCRVDTAQYGEMAFVAVNALPDLIVEVEELRKGIDPWRRICARDKARIEELEEEVHACDISGCERDRERIECLEAVLWEIDEMCKGTLPLTAQIKEIARAARRAAK